MKASTRKCTDAKPCNLMNCYACRRRLIDQTATAMLDAGATPEAVDRYRHPAINALAFEIESPKPKAPKAAPVTVDTDLMARTLRQQGSRSEGAVYLRVYTVVQLKALAKVIGVAASKLRKEELISALIDLTIQAQLDHAAILNGAKA